MRLFIAVPFIFLSLAPSTGKVVLETGIEGVRFFLDGTFVSTTDADGKLVMEGFPSGRFNYALEKSGFRPIEGTFDVSVDQASIIEARMVSLVSAPSESKAKPQPTPRESLTSLKALSDTDQTADGDTLRPVPDHSDVLADVVEEAHPIETSSPSGAPNVIEPTEQPSSVAGIFLGLLGVLSLAALLIWTQRQKASHSSQRIEQLPAAGDPLSICPEPSTEDELVPVKERPEFIDQIRRREELIKAGFVGDQTKSFDRDEAAEREKETVIVLPKEAHRYEEEL